MEPDVLAFGYSNAYRLDPDYQADISIAEGILNSALHTTGEYIDSHDYAGYSISTQEDAQIALEALNNAIVEKDKIRANLDAIQTGLKILSPT